MVSLVFAHLCVSDLLGHSEVGSGTVGVSLVEDGVLDDTLTDPQFIPPPNSWLRSGMKGRVPKPSSEFHLGSM